MFFSVTDSVRDNLFLVVCFFMEVPKGEHGYLELTTTFQKITLECCEPLFHSSPLLKALPINSAWVTLLLNYTELMII